MPAASPTAHPDDEPRDLLVQNRACPERRNDDLLFNQARPFYVAEPGPFLLDSLELQLCRGFKRNGLPVQTMLLLHDGIWFTCPSERVTVTRVTEEIQRIMENFVKLSVPLQVELR